LWHNGKRASADLLILLIGIQEQKEKGAPKEIFAKVRGSMRKRNLFELFVAGGGFHVPLCFCDTGEDISFVPLLCFGP
jgi:hypothetical protein